MKRFAKALTQPGMGCAWLCFLIHFLNEVICFYAVGRVQGDNSLFWLIALVYDALAFLPQALLAAAAERFPGFPLGPISVIMLALGFFPLALHTSLVIPALVILSLGNACLHVSLAETSFSVSSGHLSHSAVFVGGGAFGVISGKLLASSGCPVWIAASAIPLAFILLLLLWMRGEHRPGADEVSAAWADRYRSPRRSDTAVLLLATLVVAVRSYMGNGIPTSWNRSVWQTVFLYAAMGFGKALGGILADAYGIRRTAFISIALSLPLLLFGDRLMAVSLIGILLFSMTMPVSLGALVSVLPDNPGVAFGLTTVGLFVGTLPSFFCRIEGFTANAVMIAVLSIACLIACFVFLPKDDSYKKS